MRQIREGNEPLPVTYEPSVSVSVPNAREGPNSDSFSQSLMNFKI